MGLGTPNFRYGETRVDGSTKTAFVLAGGGSLGAVEVGMLQTLLDRGISADLVGRAPRGAAGRWEYAAADPKHHLGEIDFS